MWYQEVQNLWHWYDIPSRSHWDCHRLPIFLQNVKASAKRTSCCGSKFYCGLPYLEPRIVTSCKHSIEMDGKGTSWLQQSSCYFSLQISRTDLGSRHSTDWWQVWPSDPPSCVTRVVWRSIHKNNLRTHIERIWKISTQIARLYVEHGASIQSLHHYINSLLWDLPSQVILHCWQVSKISELFANSSQRYQSQCKNSAAAPCSAYNIDLSSSNSWRCSPALAAPQSEVANQLCATAAKLACQCLSN